MSQAWAQWTNRYPKQEGFNHHIYVEGYDMPVMGAGPSDPAASPDGRSLAFAAHGWLWLLDLESGHARRLTSGAGMDSRPAWSPDGTKLAFVRDDSKDTDLFVLDLPTGQESPVVQTESIDLDPAYSPDGKQLYYSSGIDGNLDIWRLDIGSDFRDIATGLHKQAKIRF
jgi:TolB protein